MNLLALSGCSDFNLYLQSIFVATEYYNDALNYHKQKDYTRAIESYEKAIELNPSNSDAYNNLAVTVQNRDGLDEALPYYKMVASLGNRISQEWLKENEYKW